MQVISNQTLQVSIFGGRVPSLEALCANNRFDLKFNEALPPSADDPGINGSELVVLVRPDESPESLDSLLKFQSSHPNTPFVLIDSQHRPDVAQRVLKGGFQDYLAQPELSEALLERSIFYALDRWEILQESRAKENQFRQLTEYINEVFLLSELKTGKLLHVSSAFESIWGRDPENLYEDPDQLLEAIHPEDRDRVRQARDYEEGETDSFPELEYRVIHPDGTVRWVRDKATIIRNDRDEPYRMARVIEDNTRTKSLEQELKQSNEDLQNFAYVISHDLQEPLRMITGYLELLQERFSGDLDEKAQQYIQEAVDGAERMKGMISDLLTYSRIRTHGDPFEPVNVTEVLDDISADFQQALEQQNASLVYGDLPTVRADRGQLRHLFQNLIENGIKFSGEQDPRIEISATREGGRWEFRVEDNGIGINPDSQEDIFVIFRRFHGDEYSGTGLGLALCRGIVKRHGGKIWAESDGETGSTFCFTLEGTSHE